MKSVLSALNNKTYLNALKCHNGKTLDPTYRTFTTVNPSPHRTSTTVKPSPYKIATTVNPSPHKTAITVKPSPQKTATTVKPSPYKTAITVKPSPIKLPQRSTPHPTQLPQPHPTGSWRCLCRCGNWKLKRNPIIVGEMVAGGWGWGGGDARVDSGRGQRCRRRNYDTGYHPNRYPTVTL
jgi:hypothetical protein